MTQITVQIKDQDMPDFLAWLEAHGYPPNTAQTDEVPLWQQELVLERLKNSTPAQASEAEEVLARVFAPFKA